MPSSAALARAMLAPIDFASARTIVEFGPGTGAFTREIAARLTPGCRYLGIELNPEFVRKLAADFPRLTFVHGSVADLAQILASEDIDRDRRDRVRAALGDAADLAAGDGVRRNGSSAGARGGVRDLRLSSEPRSARRLGAAAAAAPQLRRGRPLARRLGERPACLRVYLPKANVSTRRTAGTVGHRARYRVTRR